VKSLLLINGRHSINERIDTSESGPGIATYIGMNGFIWGVIRHRDRDSDLNRELQRIPGSVGLYGSLCGVDANSTGPYHPRSNARRVPLVISTHRCGCME